MSDPNTFGVAGRRRAIARWTLVATMGLAGVAVAALAGVWSPEPPPRFETTEISVNGVPYAGTAIEVRPGDVVTLSTTSADDDTLTEESVPTVEPDGASVVWTTSDGSLSASRVSSGSSVQWTAPTLSESEDSRSVTVTAQADDDSTSPPGDPLDGHDPNRDDMPGVQQFVLFQVKACKVTGASSNKATVTVSENFTLTATGDNLDDVEWLVRRSYQGTFTNTGETGATLTTSSSSAGRFVFRARCSTRVTSYADVTVTVVDVDRVIRDGSNPEESAGMGKVGTKVTVRAMPNPPDASFPANQPTWTIDKPVGSMVANPGPGATADVTPDIAGTYTIKAKCGMGTEKSYVLKVGGTRVESTVRIIMRDPDVQNQGDFDVSRGGGGYPAGPAKIIMAFDVTVGFDTGAPPNKDIEIKAVAVGMFGSPSGAAGFTNVNGTFAAVSGIPAAKRKGDTQYTGAAASGCVVLDAANSDGPVTPAYNPAGNVFPNAATNYPFRSINANGRWFLVNYSIAVPGGGAPPTLSVTGGQQPIAANDAARKCP